VGKTPQIRLGLAQIDPTVGDIDGNTSKIGEWIGRARDAGVDLVVFPELCVPGYPAEDLYLKRHFVEANRRAVDQLAVEVTGIAAVVGFAETGRCGPSIASSACPTTPSSTSSATSRRGTST